jgi:hypothetical protein
MIRHLLILLYLTGFILPHHSGSTPFCAESSLSPVFTRDYSTLHNTEHTRCHRPSQSAQQCTFLHHTYFTPEQQTPPVFAAKYHSPRPAILDLLDSLQTACYYIKPDIPLGHAPFAHSVLHARKQASVILRA